MWYNTGVNHTKSSGLLSQRRYLFSTYDRGVDTMSDHTPTQTQLQLIPCGYCHCGCGQITRISQKTDNRCGWVKGQPLRYIQGHQGKHFALTVSPNPSGLCMCGCGQSAPVAGQSDIAKGYVKGEPMRFVIGHHQRLRVRLVEDRFWEKVDRRGPDECWEWQGARNSKGYGELGRAKGKKNEYAHRLAYRIHYGSISEGMFVLHRCDNPPCCNPRHLFEGTPQDNTDDMIAKGRQGNQWKRAP